MDSIYLDHNATAPILPEAAEALRDASLRYRGNPASQHQQGRQARRALEEARGRIGELLGAQVHGMDADRVILTSGGSEANNLALLGLATAEFFADRGGEKPGISPVIVSAVEHPSVAEAATHLERQGARVDALGVDPAGVVRISELRALLESEEPIRRPRVASIMLANSETGVLQPVAQAAPICRHHGVALHTDATQAIGKVSVDFRNLGVAALTCAAHKFNGPVGIGALLLRHDAALTPQSYGGFQQAGLRPGTEMVALAIGMRTALEAWHRDAAAVRERLGALRDELESRIADGYPEVLVIGREAPRLPNTSNLAFPGIDRQELAMALDLAGVACSTGSACASGSSQPSPVHVAMGLDAQAAMGAMRFSLGLATTAAEIAQAAERILKACHRLRRND